MFALFALNCICLMLQGKMYLLSKVTSAWDRDFSRIISMKKDEKNFTAQDYLGNLCGDKGTVKFASKL